MLSCTPIYRRRCSGHPGPAGGPGVTEKPTLALEQEAGSNQRQEGETGQEQREHVRRVPTRLGIESPQDPACPCPGPRPRERQTGCRRGRARDHACPQQPAVGTAPRPSAPWPQRHGGRQVHAVQRHSAKRRHGHSTAGRPSRRRTQGRVQGPHSDTKGHGLRCHFHERPRTPRLQAKVDQWLSGRGVTVGGAGATSGLRKVPKTTPKAPRAAASFTANRARVSANFTRRKGRRGSGGRARRQPRGPGRGGGHRGCFAPDAAAGRRAGLPGLPGD